MAVPSTVSYKRVSYKKKCVGGNKGSFIIYEIGEGSLFTGWGYSSLVRFNRKILVYNLYKD